MKKRRLVLDTTDEKKQALVERLDLQGESFSEWIEGQIEAEVAPSADVMALGFKEPATIEDLLDPSRLDDLSAADWAFTTADTRYLTHDLHPYPAKFPPQIPGQLIAGLSLPGDLVLDPFGGSGTTAVEAVRLRRRAVSVDANPLSQLMGRAKTSHLDSDAEGQLQALQGVIQSHIASAAGQTHNWSEGLAAAHFSHIPAIPNINKWFCVEAIGELALIRHLIESLTLGVAQDAALLAMSRIVTRVSNQDSETRYVAKAKSIEAGLTLRAFSDSLRSVMRKLNLARPIMARASAEFVHGDARSQIDEHIAPSSVDLIVTSPPYPNATDYHLYHRFRLFWLGWDPRHLGAVEIGSHLKHQRKGTDFTEYVRDMSAVMDGCYRALQPGRHAVFIVGDAVFKGESFSTSDALAVAAKDSGFEVLRILSRPIHETRRSFSKPARRARSEQLLVLRRPNRPIPVRIVPPQYKMWQFERTLRAVEVAGLGVRDFSSTTSGITTNLAQPELWKLRRLAFSSAIELVDDKRPQPVWQKVLENGDAKPATRKDPKYATHGIHAYKGKFYPQLAKSLLNASRAGCGSRVLDPYCGSGTVPLEGFLNGYRAFGTDMNPLAAKISRAKTGVLLVDHEVIRQAAAFVTAQATGKLSLTLDQFPVAARDEMMSWFPTPVVAKLNFVLARIRLLGQPALIEFFEILLSSVIRDVSQQEPGDLRIRRRRIPLEDAPVLELFHKRVSEQMLRLEKYWRIESLQPGHRYAPVVGEGDNRLADTFHTIGVGDGSIDAVVTSPPYATALPYIDTDRLSILALFGTPASERTGVEEALTGSREIRKRERTAFEQQIEENQVELPAHIVQWLKALMVGNRESEAGFRRQNMAALLTRYFGDMRSNLTQVLRVMKPGARAYYVVGDSRTKVAGDWMQIPTCDHINDIAASLGAILHQPISIDVTTERMLHAKNAITENKILIFEKT